MKNSEKPSLVEKRRHKTKIIFFFFYIVFFLLRHVDNLYIALECVASLNICQCQLQTVHSSHHMLLLTWTVSSAARATVLGGAVGKLRKAAAHCALMEQLIRCTIAFSPVKSQNGFQMKSHPRVACLSVSCLRWAVMRALHYGNEVKKLPCYKNMDKHHKWDFLCFFFFYQKTNCPTFVNVQCTAAFPSFSVDPLRRTTLGILIC